MHGRHVVASLVDDGEGNGLLWSVPWTSSSQALAGVVFLGGGTLYWLCVGRQVVPAQCYGSIILWRCACWYH